MKKCIVMVAIFSMICATAYAGLNDGIVSAWSFDDGTAADEAGRNNGIIHGATAAAGVHGGALDFDGTDNYVEIPDSPSLHLSEGLTVAGWMNPREGKDHAAICWKGDMIGWGANFSWRVATTNEANMTWGRCPDGIEGWFATDAVLPGLDEWIHVAMTCLAPGAPTTLRAYVNGEDVTDVTGQDGHTQAPPFQVFEGEPVEIGVGRGIGGTEGNDTFFNGLIDDVIIYNRGLSEAEINELMDTDLVTAVQPSGKIASVWGKIKSQ